MQLDKHLCAAKRLLRYTLVITLMLVSSLPSWAVVGPGSKATNSPDHQAQRWTWSPSGKTAVLDTTDQPKPARTLSSAEKRKAQRMAERETRVRPTKEDRLGPRDAVETREGKQATLAMILGIAGLLLFSFLTGIPAFILGLRALRTYRQGKHDNKNEAIWAIVLGAYTIVWFLFILVVVTVNLLV